MTSPLRVLVTGGSGFVGSHCIAALLAAGHEVRTTVRSLTREADVRAMLREGGAEAGNRLSFVAADLVRDAGWSEAVAECDAVLHVASPFPPGQPKHEDELIVPAREGTLRVLRAAREAKVRRVVVTSSFAAIGYGHANDDKVYDESDWSNVDGPDVQAYIKSKTLAERAAWDFLGREGGQLELSVINPTGVFGPVFGADFASSISLVKQMLDGAMPACPRMYFGTVDVRDLADLHLRAMTSPAAKGERFLAVSGPPVSLLDAAKVLRARLGSSARRVPRVQLPDWVVRLGARKNPLLRAALPQLGKIRNASSEKARRVLGWSPRSSDETIAATGESLVRLGLIKAFD